MEVRLCGVGVSGDGIDGVADPPSNVGGAETDGDKRPKVTAHAAVR